jgi:hypothetical protein
MCQHYQSPFTEQALVHFEKELTAIEAMLVDAKKRKQALLAANPLYAQYLQRTRGKAMSPRVFNELVNDYMAHKDKQVFTPEQAWRRYEYQTLIQVPYYPPLKFCICM